MVKKKQKRGWGKKNTRTDALAPNKTVSSPILDLSRFASHKIISTQIDFSHLSPG